MAIEVTGKIYLVRDTVQVSERFTKREFVLELADNPKYPQLVMFQATGDRCAALDGLNEGDEVRVSYNLRGREWRSPSGEIKYFNTLDAWKIEPVGGPAKSIRTGGGPRVASPEPVPPGIDDDIPFATADMAHEPSPIAHVIRGMVPGVEPRG